MDKIAITDAERAKRLDELAELCGAENPSRVDGPALQQASTALADAAARIRLLARMQEDAAKSLPASRKFALDMLEGCGFKPMPAPGFGPPLGFDWEKHSAQTLCRNKPEKVKCDVEGNRIVMAAILEALTQEGVVVWPGDGASIVQQMVMAQARLREAAEAEKDRLQRALTDCQSEQARLHLSVRELGQVKTDRDDAVVNAAYFMKLQEQWQKYAEDLERAADPALAKEVQEQRAKSAQLRDRNERLEADQKALKYDLQQAGESMAALRSQLELAREELSKMQWSDATGD